RIVGFMVDDREIEEAWRVGCFALIPEKSKESNNNIVRMSVMWEGRVHMFRGK
ncbi:hypothetical protein L9F63_022205, partial [Diploptera punctata]